MAARKRVRVARPAAGAAAGHEGDTTASDSLRKVSLVVSVEHDLVPGSTVHILRQGLALCGAGTPSQWPSSHLWIGYLDPGAHLANCTACLLVHQAPAVEAAAKVRDQVGRNKGRRRAVEIAPEALGALLDHGLQSCEAKASVALDNDPEARTYSLEHCDLCNRLGTVDVEVVVFKDANDRTWWRCAPSLGCLDAAAVDAALAAMRAGTYLPEQRGRALASTPPADLGGVRTVTSQAEADALLGEGALRFPAAPSMGDSTIEVNFDPLRNYSPPPSMHAGKPGLYLNVDLSGPSVAPSLRPGSLMLCMRCGNEAHEISIPCPPPDEGNLQLLRDIGIPPQRVGDSGMVHITCVGTGKPVSLDPDRSWQMGGDPISDIQAGIRAQHAAWAKGAPAQTREQAEAMVAKLEQVLLGPDRERAELIKSLDAAAERIEQRLDAEVIGPLRAELAAARLTTRNIAERFRCFTVAPRDPDLDELLALVVGSYPRGELVIRGLGVDPGYAHLGFVVIDFGESFMRIVHREKLNTDTSDTDDVRLNRIADKINALVWQLAPSFVAYENVAAVHAGIASMAKRGKAGARGDNAGARRQLEVSGMIRSATRRYGCTGYTVTPTTARRGVLGKATKGATKRDVRDAVERILGVRGLSLELSDAAAIVLAGYGKHCAATKPKGRRRRK